MSDGKSRLRRQLVTALMGQLAGRKATPPLAGAILWRAFNHLSRQRTWHSHGANPIQMADIAAYCGLMRLPLDPHHVTTLLAMDRAWLDHVLTTRTPTGGPPASQSPLTPALFDALWG